MRNKWRNFVRIIRNLIVTVGHNLTIFVSRGKLSLIFSNADVADMYDWRRNAINSTGKITNERVKQN